MRVLYGCGASHSIAIIKKSMFTISFQSTFLKMSFFPTSLLEILFYMRREMIQIRFVFFFFLSFSNEVSVELYSMFVLRGTIIRVHIDVPKILTLIPKNVKHFSQLEHRGI